MTVVQENFEHLRPEACALLVIDIQERLMPVIADHLRVTERSVLLIRAARELGMPVLATTQYVERIGPLLPPVRTALGEVASLDKLEFDCLANPGIVEACRGLPRQVNTLIVCGVETHICVYQTVLGGLKSGYRMWVAADAVSSRTKENHAIGLDCISRAGGLVGSSELLIYDLLGRAGTPAFKAMLPLLK